ncbi:MAG: DUF2269 domain-containing protein [Proteobacteria bacterium]|nr:DUF2269 domain-containing protein [Pseudomonadota bacterium]
MELDLYPILESLHILSATILFGTGLGTAFHMWMAHKSGNVEAIAVAARTTVKADWWFTAPAIIGQLVTGIGMIVFVGFPYDLPWLVSSYVLFAIAGACWIPVVKIQMHVAELAASAAKAKKPLPEEYFDKMKVWYRLGWPAFIAVLMIFYMMVMKPDLWMFW